MTLLEDKIQRFNDLLEDKTLVFGEIYRITNTSTNKMYIGQVVSHRKNKDKYRPFGYLKRLDDHISEALNQTKKNECVYLNNSIRKHGKDKFTVELIIRCELSDIDRLEQYYITHYDTLYPKGYNLTLGGKGVFAVKTVDKIVTEKVDKVAYKHSEQTKAKMSMRLKAERNRPEVKQRLSKNAQLQYDQNKLEKFKDFKIDHNNLEQYIRPIISQKTHQVYYYQVHIDGVRTDFRSKHSPLIELKDRAIAFLRQLPTNSVQNPKIKLKLKSENSPK